MHDTSCTFQSMTLIISKLIKTLTYCQQRINIYAILNMFYKKYKFTTKIVYKNSYCLYVPFPFMYFVCLQNKLYLITI